MGFAAVAYALQGDTYEVFGRTQGGKVGRGSSRVAEYEAISMGLNLIPPGASVVVESDLEELVKAFRGEANPGGEVEPYWATIQEIIRAKELKVRAHKVSRKQVEAAHTLANRGRKELASMQGKPPPRRRPGS